MTVISKLFKVIEIGCYYGMKFPAEQTYPFITSE